MTDNRDLHHIHDALMEAQVALMGVVNMHPENVDLRSLMEMQAVCKQALPIVEAARKEIDDPERPIITDD